MFSEAPVERIEPYVFDGNALFACRAEFSAPLGLADMPPIGSLVAGAGEAIAFDEGFEHERAVTIARFPILLHLTRRQAEDFRCQIARLDPGQNQKASVVDHEVEVFLALLMTPTDELVARGDLPSAGTKPEQGERLVV